MTIKELTPSVVWDNFYQLTRQPRPSKHEEKVRAFLLKWAEDHKVEAFADETGNVIMRLPATPGYENRKGVILQGHMDMVPQKNADVEHDFVTDPIETRVDGDWLRACGTTLGADNGIAVAMALAVLADKTLTHPALECVFTVAEETGMFGAAGIDTSVLKGRQMINLDSEEEGIVTVSCAGGMRVRLYKDIEWKKEKTDGIKIEIDSLVGGHSGCDIHLEHANANKLAARMMYSLMEKYDSMRIVSYEGGTKDNAIPRNCTIELSFDKDDIEAAFNTANDLADEILLEISSFEPDAAIKVERTEYTKHMKRKATADIVKLAYLAPDGALSRNVKAGGFIVTSINMGIVGMEDDRFCFKFSPRSSVESLQKQTENKLRLLSDTFGFDMKCDSSYPGWKYSENSPLRDAVCAAYKEMYGKDMKVEAIHAGLECGLFSSKIEGLDAVAIGPTITRCHTPDERLDLRSVERTYKLLTKILAELAK